MKQWPHRFAVSNVILTLLLLMAGALVTGTGSGLAVPDWPLSYGQFFPQMVGGVLYEHGHRMIAGIVAAMTWILCLLLWVTKKPAPLRWVSLAASLTVVIQAVLGGITVLFRLPKPVSITHACLAQIFFSLSVVLAVISGPSWKSSSREISCSRFFGISYFGLAVVLTSVFFLQLLAGATMRHFGAGLAIPDFPTVFGGILPPTWDFAIAVHYLHRAGALFIVCLVILMTVITLRYYLDRTEFVIPVGVMAAAVAIQGMFGAFIIWMKRPVFLTTVHLATGAICLAASVVVVIMAGRSRA